MHISLNFNRIGGKKTVFTRPNNHIASSNWFCRNATKPNEFMKWMSVSSISRAWREIIERESWKIQPICLPDRKWKILLKNIPVKCGTIHSVHVIRPNFCSNNISAQIFPVSPALCLSRTKIEIQTFSQLLLL